LNEKHSEPKTADGVSNLHLPHFVVSTGFYLRWATPSNRFLEDFVSRPHTFALELSSSQRSALKGHAHSLRPVVQVGNGGFTDSLKAEIARGLDTHELMKIQVPGQNSAGEKKDALKELSASLPARAHVVARIGRTVILYLEKEPEDAQFTLKGLM
jgi:RNA-binding protein